MSRIGGRPPSTCPSVSEDWRGHVSEAAPQAASEAPRGSVVPPQGITSALEDLRAGRIGPDEYLDRVLLEAVSGFERLPSRDFATLKEVLRCCIATSPVLSALVEQAAGEDSTDRCGQKRR